MIEAAPNPVTTVMRALADPTRRAVFERLRAGPLPVNAVAAGMPVSRPAVSQRNRPNRGST